MTRLMRLDASPIEREWNGNERMRAMAPEKLPSEDLGRLRQLYRASHEEGFSNTLTRRMIVAARPGGAARCLIQLGADPAPHVRLLVRWVLPEEKPGIGTFIGGLSVDVHCFWAQQGSQSVGMKLFKTSDSEHRFVKFVSKRVRMGLGYALWNQSQLDRALQQLKQEQR